MMSDGPWGAGPRESNTALVVTIVLLVLAIPALFSCGGIAFFFWALRPNGFQSTPFVEAVPVNEPEDWAAAAEAEEQILEKTPDDTLAWLRVAPLVVLAEDTAAYRDFCSRMAEQFDGTENVQTAERTCKACLLVPGAIELEDLPHLTLARSLDAGNAPEEIASWLWCARSLVAYRSGDAESAVTYTLTAEELNPTPMAEALHLSIRACARCQLGQLDESRSDVKRAHEVIEGLVNSHPRWRRHHDVLMAKILLQEAEAILDGAAEPTPTDTMMQSDEASAESQSVPGSEEER